MSPPKSKIYIGGKRIAQMREIAEEKFGQSFLSIEIKDGMFVIRLVNDVDTDNVKKFTVKYPLCRVEIFPRIEFSIVRGKKQPA